MNQVFSKDDFLNIYEMKPFVSPQIPLTWGENKVSYEVDKPLNPRKTPMISNISSFKVNEMTYFFCDFPAPVSLNPLANGLWSIFIWVIFSFW